MQSLGFDLIEFNGVKGRNYIVDNEGYQYYTKLEDLIYSGAMPEKFHKCNKFTIDNIHNFIRTNNIQSQLLSTEYNGNVSPLLFRCQCGEEFQRGWNNFLKGHRTCFRCSKALTVNSHEKIINILNKYGFNTVSDIAGLWVKDYIDLIDKDGYLYYYRINELLRMRKGHNTFEKIHANNPYSIYNINIFLQNHFKDFKCVSKEYNRNTDLLELVHLSCGTHFYVNWAYIQDAYMQRHGANLYQHCPTCGSYKLESFHASALKQVFLHEYPNTVLEDSSCISPITGRALPTDIVNHELKIAVEIQSQRHDKPYQQKKDEIKRQYWIDRGYSFYDPDIRNYTILGMIQLFFPNIKETPKYINFNFSNNMDYTEIQHKLDKGMSIKEIAQIMGLNDGSIRSGVREKRLVLPKTYKENILNWTPILQLDANGTIIREFSTIEEADRAGFKRGTVQRVLNKKQPLAYNSFWIRKKEYVQGNYIIPQMDDSVDIAVDRVDGCGNIIKSYDSIFEAEKESQLKRDTIKRIVYCPNRKNTSQEYWQLHT